MKVLMATGPVGGVWSSATELARSLAARDVEIALATMGAPLSAAQRAQANALPNVTLFESDYKLEWMDDPWDDVARSGDWLLEIERNFAPDVVHLNGYAHGQLPFIAPIVVVAHSCVLSWGEGVKPEAAPVAWGRYRHEVSAGLAAADLVFAPSQTMQVAIQKHYGPLANVR